MSSGTKVSVILATLLLAIVGGYFMLLPEPGPKPGLVPQEPSRADHDQQRNSVENLHDDDQPEYFDMDRSDRSTGKASAMLTVPVDANDSRGNSPTDPNWPPTTRLPQVPDVNVNDLAKGGSSNKGGGMFYDPKQSPTNDTVADTDDDDSWLTEEPTTTESTPQRETTLLPASNKPITIDDNVPSSEFVEYKVQQGDSFWTIAKAWFGDGAKADLIAAANPDVDSAKMQIGQVLRLPAKNTVAKNDRKRTVEKPVRQQRGLPADARFHTVGKGDSLSRIAQKYYSAAIKWQVIYEANKDLIGDDPAKLKLGQKLYIPE